MRLGLDAVLALGAFGESRALCGVHSASAITEARSVAPTVVATLHSSPAFRGDMQAARVQLAALRDVPGPQACQPEAALIAMTPW
jgi:acid phosphatase (class A)